MTLETDTAAKQSARQTGHDIGLFSVIFGVLGAFAIFVAVYNAQAGQAWALDLCRSLPFLLTSIAFMFAAIAGVATAAVIITRNSK